MYTINLSHDATEKLDNLLTNLAEDARQQKSETEYNFYIADLVHEFKCSLEDKLHITTYPACKENNEGTTKL